MSDLFRLIWCALIGIFRPRAALQAEILVLRHQLIVLRRKAVPKSAAKLFLQRRKSRGAAKQPVQSPRRLSRASVSSGLKRPFAFGSKLSAQPSRTRRWFRVIFSPSTEQRPMRLLG